jgi:hypothetical protein
MATIDTDKPIDFFVGKEIYTCGEVFLPSYLAKEQIARWKNCNFKEVQGNHHTMLFGLAAQEIVGCL